MIKLLTIGAMLLCLGLPARAAEGDLTPFDPDLQRLAEILGSLQYLRPPANGGARSWQAIILVTAATSRPTEPAHPPQTLQFGAFSTKAPRSPVKLPRDMPIKLGVINLSFMSGLCRARPRANVPFEVRKGIRNGMQRGQRRS
jgi:hypothetical protein